MEITLKPTALDDLQSLFQFQTDPEGIRLAAFTYKDPADEAAYMKQWTKIVENPAINMQTIFVENTIVGSIIHFDMGDETNVSYWIDRAHWGKGIASKALQSFVAAVPKRPLHGRVAFDNYGSQKVLEKSGFKRIGEETNFANGRNEDIVEYIYLLEA